MALRQSASELAGSIVQLVHNRVELFGLELAQEKDRGLRLFTQAAIAAIFLLLSAAVLTFLCAAFFWETPHRLWVLAALGLGYGLIGLVMLLRAKSHMASYQHAFSATVDELRRDVQIFSNTVQASAAGSHQTPRSEPSNASSNDYPHSSSTSTSGLNKVDER
ncbi:MAG: phage holin family protein [Burkholderiaceae bacterium]|nr:phage holin family protein [Burkholderiaceae bacterium]